MNRANLTRAAVLSLVFFARFQPLSADFQDCAGKLTPSDRQHCEDMFARQVQAGSRTSQLPGGWRLVKTTDQRPFRRSVGAVTELSGALNRRAFMIF
jgi:hypothetical protein